jgi:hypothetical protein
MLSALATPSSLIGAAGTWLLILAGAAGSAAWLFGTSRRSLSDAQTAAVTAQASTILAQTADIAALKDQIRGTELLSQMVDSLRRIELSVAANGQTARMDAAAHAAHAAQAHKDATS